MNPSLYTRNLHRALDCIVVEGARAVRPTKHQQRAADIFTLLALLGVPLDGAAQTYHAVSSTRFGAKHRRRH